MLTLAVTVALAVIAAGWAVPPIAAIVLLAWPSATPEPAPPDPVAVPDWRAGTTPADR